MLSKILLTIVVIATVILVYRTKAASRQRQPSEAPAQGSLSVRAVAIAIIFVLIAVSSAVFFFKYQSDNRIITIRVISEDGASTVYQARQKAIKGRHFRTLDNRDITLGESDRIEMDGL